VFETFFGAHFGLRWQAQRDAALLATLGSPISRPAISQSYPARLIDLPFSRRSEENGVALRFPPHSKNAAVVGLG